MIVSDLVIMGNWDQVTADISKHPRAHEKHIQYGTAGFRTKAELLDHVMYRCEQSYKILIGKRNFRRLYCCHLDS